MFTLWYSVLSWREYRDTISNKACPRNCDVRTSPPKTLTPSNSNDHVVTPTIAKASPTPVAPVAKAQPAVPPRDIPAPTPPKPSSPLPVPKAAPAPVSPPPPAKKPTPVPVTPPPPAKNSAPISMPFEKMEQMQENKIRGISTPSANSAPKVPAPPARSPLPAQKLDNSSRASANFIKRENSYSSEEEAEDDDDEEEEEDDSEIERIDLHSKYKYHLEQLTLTLAKAFIDSIAILKY